MKLCRALVIGAMVAVQLAAHASGARAERSPTITVMTQNLYQGTELEHASAASSLGQLLLGVATDYNSVIATDFPQRANALADEISQSGPALLGIQEVALWKTQLPYNPASPPDKVSYDFLQILLDALAAHGMHYATVIARDNYTLVGAGAFSSGLMGVSLTDRSAILARTDLPAQDLTLSNAQQGGFQHADVVQTPGGAFQTGLGWLSVNVKAHGKVFRFISPHLGYSTTVMAQQSQELLDGPAATSMPVVIAGDFNSVTTDPAYGRLVAAGFTDEWAAANPSDPGWTAWQTPPDSIVNPISKLNARIDYVLARGVFAPLDLHLVGADPSARTASGLWPSDHAGLVAKLALGAAAVPTVSSVRGVSRAATASFTVSFSSNAPGQGEVYFGSGSGCAGLVEVATHDLHPGTTLHSVVVTGNDLPGTIGDNGIQPGATYWYEAVTIAGSGTEIDNNSGACYSVTLPTS
jgi:hypothetical protein